MGRIIKSILMTIAIACAGVSIFFIITIIGNRDVVVDAYNNLSDSKERGADVVRNNFLQVYGTYGEELFIALGINKTDFVPGGVGDSDPGTPGEELYKVCTCIDKCTSDTDFDDTCEVCKMDWKQCAFIPPCTCAGPDRCTSTNIDQSCDACKQSVANCKVQVQGQSQGKYTQWNSAISLYECKQTSTLWGNVQTNSGSWAQYACGTIAVYNAARNLGHTDKDMGDLIYELNKSTLSFDADGYLVGTAKDVGENGTQWNAVVSTTGLNMSGPIDHNAGWPTSPGDYVIYYSHSNKHEKNGNSTTNAHWIYVHINSGSKACITNPGKNENDYSKLVNNNYMIRYYTVS